MKVLTATVYLFLLVGSALAQAPAHVESAPGVEVIKNDWRRIVRNPALDDDPLTASREAAEFEREKKAVARANEIRRELGREPLQPTRPISTGIRMDTPIVTYLYEAKIRNTGTKILRYVVWQYSFFDEEKNEEVSRTECVSKVNLRPGKTAGLVGATKTPPLRVVDVSRSVKHLKGAYAERVVITRLEYDDGTFWQRPAE